jgi:hypothetical protein
MSEEGLKEIVFQLPGHFASVKLKKMPSNGIILG